MICPQNFEDRATLVGAEIARIEERPLDAMDLYERAIVVCARQRLCPQRGDRQRACRSLLRGTRLRDNRKCLSAGSPILLFTMGSRRQGPATRNPLSLSYASRRRLAPPQQPSRPPSSIWTFATVVKVSQAVSGEMVLERLIDTLMRLAIEHAGAERGLLLLSRGHDLGLEAEAMTGRDGIIVRRRDESAAALPDSIVHYVLRSREIVILDDALAHPTYSSDVYIRKHSARSVLCLPLVSESKVTGVLYLENNLTPDVFTPDRITVLKVLASQAAISLENSRLYRELADREAKIRRLVDANIMGICIWKLEGSIVAANEEFLRMLQYDREDVVSGSLALDRSDAARIARARRTRRWPNCVQPEHSSRIEKEFFRKDGSRMPVLIGGALFERRRQRGRRVRARFDRA